MPNWCFTTITFYSTSRTEILEMHDKFNGIQEEGGHFNVYANKFFLKPEADNMYRRGSVNYVDDIFERAVYSCFTIHTETAWIPAMDFWHAIVSHHYPNVRIAYLSEEPGCCQYFKWDADNLFYPDVICVDGCVPTKTGECVYLSEDDHAYSDDLDATIEWLKQLLPFDFTLTPGYDNLQEQLDEYLCSHPCEQNDDCWIEVGVFKDLAPWE